MGLHRQHRLLAGRGRRAAGQPDALQPVLPGEARLLPRELRRLPVRRPATRGGGGGGGGGRQNAVAGHDLVLQPADRPVADRRRHSDARRHAPDRPRRRLVGRRAQHPAARARTLSPSTNFTALRLRRDILAQLRHRRDVAQQGRERRRITTASFGADANFRFFRDLDVNFAGAKTRLADAARARRGRRLVFEERASAIAANVLEIARRRTRRSARASTTRWASCPRVGVNNGELLPRRALPPEVVSSWLRETFPHFQIENFTKRDGGGLESRYMDWHWPVTFQNSTFIEVGVNPNVEVIDERVHDQQPPRHLRRCRAATSSTNTSCSPTPTPPRRSRSTCATAIGDFYDGYRRNYTVGGTRPHERALQRVG